MYGLKLTLASLALASLAAAQVSEVATIERHGDFSTLSVHTARPLDAVATTLGSQCGIAVNAEDPVFLFKGDLMDISTEEPRVRAGTLVPARWGFRVRFQVKPDGSPESVRDLLRSIVTSANVRSHFAYRLDDDFSAYSFVPTRTRDPRGHPIAATPLLDRPITIPLGVRRLNQSASLMAEQLSKQTGLRVSCCQSYVGGILWGMEEVAFTANGEAARAVLRRLGLNRWHVRCDQIYCFIDIN